METNEKFMRMPAVVEITGYSHQTIYRKMSKGEFPKPISLGLRAVAWLQSDIHKWMEDRINERRKE